MSAASSQKAKSRIEGYGTLLPAKWKEIYEHVDDTESEEIPTNRMPGSVGDQVREAVHITVQTAMHLCKFACHHCSH